MVMSPVTWLHLSDFHFRAIGDKFSQEQACGALIESVRSELERKSWSPSFAVVTGDVAYSGQNDEYAIARSFFDEVAAVTQISPTDFFFVPGNHDVDRSREELAFLGGRSKIDSPQQVDYYLAEEARIAPLMRRQDAFWSFVDEFTAGQTRKRTQDGLGYVVKLDLDGLAICLLALNSAWLSGTEAEEMRLVIGERHVINAVEASHEMAPHFVVAMAHHPITWLTEWDEASCRTRLLPSADVYLRGHLHAPGVSLTSSPMEPCIEIAAGSGHATRFYQNSYNVITIDPRPGECTTIQYKYDPSRVEFEPAAPTRADLKVRGSIPGTRIALAKSIETKVPNVARFADFMAGLLKEELGEVPLLVSGRVEFVLPSAAENFVAWGSLERINDFLGLRNLLRLYRPGTSLESMIEEHLDVIHDYGVSLEGLVSADPSCAYRLDRGTTPASTMNASRQGWSLNLLDELRHAGDWSELEVRARRLTDSPDSSTRRLARSRLAEALIHSDEAPKRDEGRDIAVEIASDPYASEAELLLAAAAAEVTGDDKLAIGILRNALDSGHSGEGLIAYTRQVAGRTGDRQLREAADRNSSGPDKDGNADD